jgi:hypothetical protein
MFALFFWAFVLKWAGWGGPSRCLPLSFFVVSLFRSAFTSFASSAAMRLPWMYARHTYLLTSWIFNSFLKFRCFLVTVLTVFHSSVFSPVTRLSPVSCACWRVLDCITGGKAPV